MKCLEQYNIFRKLNSEFKDIFSISGIYHNIGEIYKAVGEFDKALEFLNKSLSISELNNRLDIIPETLTKIGEVYRQKSEFSKAKNHLERALHAWKKVIKTYDFYVPNTLFSLIRLSIDLNEQDKTKEYLSLLKELENETIHASTKNLVSQYIKYTEALLLKNSKRIAKKAEAQKIFSELVNDEVVKYDITALAMINLSELLIEEYKNYEDPEVLNEVREMIQQLYELGITNNVHSITIQAIILKSRFQIIEGNNEQSLKLLEQAKQLAEVKKFNQLLDRVERIQELDNKRAHDMIKKYGKILFKPQRLDEVKLEAYLQEAEKLVNIRKLQN
ncbi:MAG: tetratricopeptide repeat protein [Candidatus Hodarchaeales archaeon]